MSNVCLTTVRITGDSDKMREFSSKMNMWTKITKPSLTGKTDSTWLGNLAAWAGILKDPIEEPKGFGLRGSIADLDYDGSSELRIDIEDAWTPHVAIIDAICEKELKDYQLTFDAYEPGFNICVTNDTDMIGTWLVDNWDDVPFVSLMVGDEGWSVKEDVVRVMLESMFTQIASGCSMETLLEEFNDSDFAQGCSIHRWTYCEPQACN